MEENRESGVHILTDGFEYDRIVEPIFDRYPAKKMIILRNESKGRYPSSEELADSFVEKIEDLPLDVEKEILDIYDFDEVFHKTRSLIKQEMEKGNPVYINVSSAPKLALVAMMAASFFVKESGKLEIFYATPEKYLIPDILEEAEKGENMSVEEIADLTEKFNESGRGSGLEDYVEVPRFPIEELSEIDYDILKVIVGEEKIESIKELVEKVANIRDEDVKRSSIQYRLEKLADSGLISKERKKKRLELSATRLGEIYVKSVEK